MKDVRAFEAMLLDSGARTNADQDSNGQHSDDQHSAGIRFPQQYTSVSLSESKVAVYLAGTLTHQGLFHPGGLS